MGVPVWPKRDCRTASNPVLEPCDKDPIQWEVIGNAEQREQTYDLFRGHTYNGKTCGSS